MKHSYRYINVNNVDISVAVNFIIVKNTCIIGDFDQFMNKYNTCARTRPYGDQFLASKFYMNEHTKPLFNANKIRFLD